MSKQERAAAIFKWGILYPSIWPRWQEWAAELYRRDRIERGVEPNKPCPGPIGVELRDGEAKP